MFFCQFDWYWIGVGVFSSLSNMIACHFSRIVTIPARIIKLKAGMSCYKLIRIWKLLGSGSDLVANATRSETVYLTISIL